MSPKYKTNKSVSYMRNFDNNNKYFFENNIFYNTDSIKLAGAGLSGGMKSIVRGVSSDAYLYKEISDLGDRDKDKFIGTQRADKKFFYDIKNT